MMTIAASLAFALALLLAPHPALSGTARAGIRSGSAREEATPPPADRLAVAPDVGGGPARDAASSPKADGTAVPIGACVFCPDGVSDPNPWFGEARCLAAAALAGTLSGEDIACVEIQVLRGACCPAKPAQVDTAIPTKILYGPDFADYKNEQKKYTILHGVLGIVGVIGSLALMWMNNKLQGSLTITVHHIFYGCFASTILFYLPFILFGSMVPSDVNYIMWNARGNQATCTVNGFMITAGSGCMILYFCSLVLYCLSRVICNWTGTLMNAKIEPFLHGVSILAPLMWSLVRLVNKNYNADVQGSCTAATYDPPHCIGYEDGEVREGFVIPCGRGRKGAAFAGVPALLFISAALVVILLLLRMMREALGDGGRIARRCGVVRSAVAFMRQHGLPRN